MLVNFSLSYLFCQQLSDFPRLEPEPQQLHLQRDAAFLPIHAGHSDGSWPAATLQHVGHGEDSELCLWTQAALPDKKTTKKTQVYSALHADIWFVWFEFPVKSHWAQYCENNNLVLNDYVIFNLNLNLFLFEKSAPTGYTNKPLM